MASTSRLLAKDAQSLVRKEIENLEKHARVLTKAYADVRFVAPILMLVIENEILQVRMKNNHVDDTREVILRHMPLIWLSYELRDEPVKASCWFPNCDSIDFILCGLECIALFRPTDSWKEREITVVFKSTHSVVAFDEKCKISHFSCPATYPPIFGNELRPPSIDEIVARVQTLYAIRDQMKTIINQLAEVMGV